MAKRIIEIKDGIMANPEFAMVGKIDFSLDEGEHIAIIGDNAAGKTRLVEVITGRHRLAGDSVRFDFSPSQSKYACDNVKYITFRDSYGSADTGYYHQLRWNSMEIDKETPTVEQLLQRTLSSVPEDSPVRNRYNHLVEMFNLKPLMDKYIITLSSGELRKFQLTKLLMTSPKVLIIDNPFIGLDITTRSQLSSLLEELSHEMSIILVLSREAEIPSFITHLVLVEGLKVGEKVKYTATKVHDTGVSYDSIPAGIENTESPVVLKFNDVSIRYGERTILKNLNWTVRQGEHWALTGENGCGKSTLLSLVCADNPQGYACDIDLFGRRRGSGESIWDIKKNIGYVSPEMHRSYKKPSPAIDIVSSGVFDTVGLFLTPTEEQRAVCRDWMERFGIADIADRNFMSLSSGEQRLCLLARAFVKNPPLLILDEPMHGLDEHARSRVRALINEYASDPTKTLIMVTHYLDELPSCINRSLFLLRN